MSVGDETEECPDMKYFHENITPCNAILNVQLHSKHPRQQSFFLLIEGGQHCAVTLQILTLADVVVKKKRTSLFCKRNVLKINYYSGDESFTDEWPISSRRTCAVR